MSDITKINIQAYDKLAKDYDSWARGFDFSNEYRQFKEYLGLEKGKVLDVGCGSGRDARALFDLGFDITGIDLSEKMLELAKFKEPGAKFVRMDFRELSFPDNFFDGFWANAALFLVDEESMKKTLGELYRVIKNGGIGYLSFKEGEGERIKEVGVGLEKRQKLYSYTELRQMLKDTGFRILLTERKEDQKRKGLFWLRYYVKKI